MAVRVEIESRDGYFDLAGELFRVKAERKTMVVTTAIGV